MRQGLDTALAELYVADGRPDEARGISVWLREFGQRLHRSMLLGNADRIEAQAAAYEGDLDSALRLARQAVGAHETTALRTELVRSLLTVGQVERRRRARSRSRTVLSRARELALDVGHQPLLASIYRKLGVGNRAELGRRFAGARTRDHRPRSISL